MNKEEKIKMMDKILKDYGVDWKLTSSYEGDTYYLSLVEELKRLIE